MTRARNLIAGGALVAGITAAGPYVVQMYQAHLEHERLMAAAIEASVEHARRKELCEHPPPASGATPGKFWQGNCLEVY
jgi:hypothetical protein